MKREATLLKRLQGTGVGARLVRGAVSASAASIIGMALSFTCQVLVARLTGKDEYGVYAYVLSWLNIIVFYAKFGIDNAAVRFMSQYRATEAWSTCEGSPGIVRLSCCSWHRQSVWQVLPCSTHMDPGSIRERRLPSGCCYRSYR